MGKIVKNVWHHYRDPVTGEHKSKYFGDGTFEDIQSQIKAFMNTITNDNEDLENDSTTV